jgi:hypothetical protein
MIWTPFHGSSCRDNAVIPAILSPIWLLTAFLFEPDLAVDGLSESILSRFLGLFGVGRS